MDFVQMLIQGGAVGVAILALFIVYKVITNHSVHSDQVIEKNAESNTKLAVSIGEHTSTIRSLAEVIKEKL